MPIDQFAKASDELAIWMNALDLPVWFIDDALLWCRGRNHRYRTGRKAEGKPTCRQRRAVTQPLACPMTAPKPSKPMQEID